MITCNHDRQYLIPAPVVGRERCALCELEAITAELEQLKRASKLAPCTCKCYPDGDEEPVLVLRDHDCPRHGNKDGKSVWIIGG